MKRFLTILLTSYMSTMLYAEKVKIGDIYYNISGNNASVVYEGSSNNYSGLTEANIPATIKYGGTTCTVVKIDLYAFYECKSLRSVTIPHTIKSIGDRAFYGSPIKSVHIDDIAAWCEITYTGGYYGPSNPLQYGADLYLNDELISDLVIPDNVTSIGRYAFYNCPSLTSVTIPNNVTTIGEKAFWNCANLASATIPNSVTSIGDEAFNKCNINEIHYGGTLQEWLEKEWKNNQISSKFSLYMGGELFTNLTIPNNITSIKDYAFAGCRSLTSVTIPSNVTSIGVNAFTYCDDITSVHINDIAAWCNITFGDAASNPLSFAKHLYVNDVEVTDLVIPNSVTEIKDYAFIECKSLNSVSIPNSVTSIGAYTFYDCSGFTSIEIPNSVKVIGKGAFNGCASLRSIICNAITPPSLGQDVFKQVNKHIPLYVPSESVFAYQAASQWGDFINILPIGSNEGIEEIVENHKQDDKLIYDGKLYILRGEKVYTMQGQEVK